MASRIENPELDRLVREMAELWRKGGIPYGQLEGMIQGVVDAVKRGGGKVSKRTVQQRYEVEKARLAGPAAHDESAASLIDKEKARERERQRARIIQTYRSTIDVLLHGKDKEPARAREKLEDLRSVDPEGASVLEEEFRERLGLKT